MRINETENILNFQRERIRLIFFRRIFSLYLVYFLFIICLSFMILLKNFFIGCILLIFIVLVIFRFFLVNFYASQRTLSEICISQNQLILKFNSFHDVNTYQLSLKEIVSIKFYNDIVMNFGGPKIKIVFEREKTIVFYLPYDISLLEAKIIGNSIENINKMI